MEAKKSSINKQCLDLIKTSEGFRSAAYPDPASGNEPWTIGYGTTVYPSGKSVRPGDKCTEPQALEWLLLEAGECEAEIQRLSKTKFSENQLSAMVSLAYNIGMTAFRKSTLFKKASSGNFSGAAKEFPKWIKAKGKMVPGLRKRRLIEQKIFLS